jgi:hypothetical protein
MGFTAAAAALSALRGRHTIARRTLAPNDASLPAAPFEPIGAGRERPLAP